MLNNCILMGRFTYNPELKTTQSDVNVVKFSLAVSRPRAGPEKEREADFIDCVAWDKTAEFICKYFKKGDPIIINGRLESKQYEDKQGNKRKTCEVIVKEVNFCAYKKDKQQYIGLNDNLNESLPF